MVLFNRAPVRALPYFGYRNADRLKISVRALRQKPQTFSTQGRWRAFRTMLTQFASSDVADFPISLELSVNGAIARHHGVTDGEGYIHFDVPLDPPATLPDRPAWESVILRWTNSDGPQQAEGKVLVPGETTRLGVISDIDDTIIETGITGNVRAVARNWRRVLAEMPDERLLVPGADIFYQAIGGAIDTVDGRAHAGERHIATENPFFYVSSSPWNLFSYLVAFQKTRGLPLGPLMLRDWGLNRETFGSGSHGAHKLVAMRDILATYPTMQFALMGDDTQGDLVAFGEIVAESPERIRAVLIRQAGDPLSDAELVAKATIESAGVPLWLGNDYTTGHEFLSEIGLSGNIEAEKLVETVETKGVSPDAGAAAPAG